MEYDIFISYSRADSAIVNTFVQQLETAGYKVWIDKTGIYTGARFKSVLVQAIEDSKVFLFFSSKDANASPWTSKEVAIAVDRKKTIIPIKLDNTRYNRDVEFDIIGLDYVDYSIRSRRGQELDKLIRTLETFLGKKQPTAPGQVKQTGLNEIILSLLKNHRGYIITFMMSLLLIVGTALFYTTIGGGTKKLHDDPETQYNLGLQYYNGDGVTQDYKEAVRWYKMSAEQGNANAQYYLGYCYKNGIGVKQDYQEAVRWYKIAAEQGKASAQNNLALCYKNGEGVEQNHKEALRWYRMAAEQGNSSAQYNLGLCYKYGEGVEQDNEEAIKWYIMAAKQGKTSAQNNLGNCYKFGQGVKQDYSEAVKWFMMAADQGDPTAQYNLGNCYEYGHGVNHNYQEALKWYRKAAGHGDEDAKKAVDRLANRNHD